MPGLADYIEVKDRIAQFKDKFPNGSLQTDPPEIRDVLGHTWIIMRAYAYRDPEDTRPGIGHAWEHVPGKTSYTIGSELMVCETSAWGRALAAIGIAVSKSVASRDEVMAAEGRPKWERATAVPDDDPFYTRPASPEPAHPKHFANTTLSKLPSSATEPHLKKIFAMLKNLGIPEAEHGDIINTALVNAGLPAVERPKELSKFGASTVIEALTALQEKP
jgi:hypothetical protein